MTSMFRCDRWRASNVNVGMIGIALVACSPAQLPSTDGQTTTTYGSNGSTDNGDPTDVTDDGPGDATSTPGDPSDTNDPDPSDTDDPDPSDTDDWFHDLGGIPDAANPPGLPNGATCTDDAECSSNDCYILPFLGGYCGECNEDADCFGGGCTAPNPFDSTPPFCNMGEPGGGCETDSVCADDLSCSTVFDLLGLIQLNTCSSCTDDSECGDQICAALVDLPQFAGQRACIDPNSLPQDAFCELEFDGDEACASGVCSVVDVMGLAQLGACGECNVDADCNGGVCVAGQLVLETGILLGSTCQ
jgi:hypothetical protein